MTGFMRTGVVFLFSLGRGKKKIKKCSFLGQLFEEMRLLTLVQPVPAIQTPPPLASRGAAKEKTPATEKKDTANSV